MDIQRETVRHIVSYLLPIAFCIISTSASPWRDWGDAGTYISMSQGLEVQQPFSSRVLIPLLVHYVHIMTGLDYMSVWYYVNLSMYITATLVYIRTYSTIVWSIFALCSINALVAYMAEPLLEASSLLFIVLAIHIHERGYRLGQYMLIALGVVAALSHPIPAIIVSVVMLYQRGTRALSVAGCFMVLTIVLALHPLGYYSDNSFYYGLSWFVYLIVSLNFLLIGYAVRVNYSMLILLTLIIVIFTFMASEITRMFFYLAPFLAPRAESLIHDMF